MYKVRIIFKSGLSQDFECDGLTVDKRSNEIDELKWDNMNPKPLYLRLADILAILVLP